MPDGTEVERTVMKAYAIKLEQWELGKATRVVFAPADVDEIVRKCTEEEEKAVGLEVMPFDEILPSVASGKSTHGLIIHEGQLTWKDEGVHLVLDLGVWWNEKTGLPLPLGGNVVLRKHGADLCSDITNDVKNSIVHAIGNPESALSFAKKWGRGISDETNERFLRERSSTRTFLSPLS